MSLGGTSQTTRERSFTDTRSPEYVQDAARYLVNAGTNMAEPFLNIPNFRVAAFTPDQVAGQYWARGIAQDTANKPNRWADWTRGVAEGFGNLYDPAGAEKWINPHTKNVLDNSLAVLEKDYRDKDASLASQFAASAVRGSGGALARGQLARGANEAAGTMAAELHAQAWDQAQQQRRANLEAALGVQRAGSAAESEDLQRQLTALQAYMGMGQQQQNQAQRIVDVPWEILQMQAGITPQDRSQTSFTQGERETESSGGGSLISGLTGLLSLPMGGGMSLGGSLFGALGSALRR